VLGTFLSGFQTRNCSITIARPAPISAGPRRRRTAFVSGHRRDRAGQEGSDATRRGHGRLPAFLGPRREPFGAPPGYFSVKDAARMIKARGKRTTDHREGKAVDTHHGTVEDLVKAGIMFVGTPTTFTTSFPNSSTTSADSALPHDGPRGTHDAHEEAVDQITLVAKEVLPRLQERAPHPSRRVTARQATESSSP